jgi:hypothetical protein
MHDFRVNPAGITSIPNFNQISSAILGLNHADRRTDKDSPICINSMRIVRRTHTKKDKRHAEKESESVEEKAKWKYRKGK